MRNFKLLIKQVDMNGYCGRENHPAKSDEGLVVTPLSLDVFYIDREGDVIELSDHQGQIVSQAHDLISKTKPESDFIGPWLQTCWVCMTPDGRILDLMDHEVEMITQ